MNDKFFLDTNVFVYSFDNRHKSKQKKAQSLIDDALSKNAGVISYQVVQEFFNVALKKFTIPLTHKDCTLYLEQTLMPLCDIYPNVDLYKHALHVHKETGFSFYDSLIVAGGLKGGCTILYSEDLQHGQKIEGLTIHNPFLV